MATSDRTTPAVPPTIREVLDTELEDARADGAPPFYGTPLATAWSTVLTRRYPLPPDVDYPNPVDNALAIAALCREIAALKGVRLPDRYGDE